MATEATYCVFDEVLDPIVNLLPPELARQILATQPTLQFQSHVRELADKASAGSLTLAEREEYAQIVEVMDLVAIAKAKLRSAIDRQNS